MAVQLLKGRERGMGAEIPSPDAVVVGGGIVGVCAALQLQLVRFALASRARRVEAISVGLSQLMAHAVDAYRPLVEGTEAEAILCNHGFLYL